MKIAEQLKDFNTRVDEKRKQGYTDSDILDGLAKRNKSLADRISKTRNRYNVDDKITNDRDLVNFMSQTFSGSMPTVRSIPLKEEPVRKEEERKVLPRRETGALSRVMEPQAGIRKGVAESMLGVASIPERGGKWIAEKTLGLAGIDKEKIPEPFRRETKAPLTRAYESKELEAKTPWEKVGKGLEFAVEFIVPVGKAGKAGKVKVGDRITRIDKQVETVLKRSKGTEKLNKYISQAKRAVTDPALPSPLELAGKSADDALNVLKKKSSEIGKAKESITKTIGAKNTGKIITTTRNKINKLLKERVGLKITEDGVKTLRGRASKVSDTSDIKLIQQVNQKLLSIEKNPTFRKVDDTIDYIQDILYKRKANIAQPMNTRIEGIMKESIFGLNKKLKSLSNGTEYVKLNDQLSEIIKIRTKLNKALGADVSKGGSLMKRVFSPTESGTKEMFAKIKSITGIDLVEDATLAKFTMDTVGDTRQISLLKGITSRYGLIEKAVQTGLRGVQTPFGKAGRIIEGKKSSISKELPAFYPFAEKGKKWLEDKF